MNQLTFPSLTAEAKYYILNYLSENSDTPHSCFEIIQIVQQHNEAIRDTIISGALHRLCSSGRIVKPSRGKYQINDTIPIVSPDYPNVLPAPTILSLLEKASSCINSFRINVSDIDDPETFLYNQKILIETQKYIQRQISRLK